MPKIPAVATSGLVAQASVDHSVGSEEQFFAGSTVVAIVPASSLPHLVAAVFRPAVVDAAAKSSPAATLATTTITSRQETLSRHPAVVQPAIQETQSFLEPESLENQALLKTRDLIVGCTAKSTDQPW